MSRIGKRVLVIPEGVTVNVNDSRVSVSGKLGSLELEVKPGIQVSVDNGNVIVTRENDSKELKQLHGTTNANIKNMIEGVSTGFKKELEINGVGFKAVVVKGMLILTLGYSHDIAFALPKSVNAKVEGNLITLSSINKQLVGQIASEIIALRKPEPYKGKGVKIAGKAILRKEGKKK